MFEAPQITTDPDQLAEDCFARMEEHFPGYQPNEANLEVIIFRTLAATIGAPLATLLVAELERIFGRFGEVVFGVAPDVAVPATAETTWTMVDNAGYTIPAGTQVAIRTAGDSTVGFTVLSDVSVPAGSTATDTGEVVISAIVPGSGANGLVTDPELIDALAYVSSINLETTTSGGADAQTPDEYLDELRATLTLLSQNAILPEDVATLALSVAGVGRALPLDLYYPGVDEVQTVTVNGSPSGGDYTVKLGGSGDPSDAITHNATAAAFETALEGSTDFDPGDASVSGSAGGPYTITFGGQYSSTNVAQLELGTNSLTGGSSPAPAFATTTAGVAADPASEKTCSVAVADEDGEALTTLVKDQVAAFLELHREINFLFYVIDPTYTQVKVSCTVTALPGNDPAGVEAAVEAAIADYLAPGNWGRDPVDPDSGVLREQDTVYRFELISLVDRVEGVDRVVQLQLAEESGVVGTADLVLDGPAPLTQPGTITATVS